MSVKPILDYTPIAKLRQQLDHEQLEMVQEYCEELIGENETFEDEVKVMSERDKIVTVWDTSSRNELRQEMLEKLKEDMG